MSTLGADDFPSFFRAIWGHAPHAWQTRLAAQVVDTGIWPDVLDLPTGSGKTAALDIALFSLACRPDDLPRRIVFVVDRRLIVDQVNDRASTLVGALAHSDDPTVAEVADRLRTLGGGALPGNTSLRGGLLPDRAWAERPDVPWIVSSTVDQFGSRLLFSGYGTSRTMQPIQAGLAGNDCLVLLDEVHLSTPFADLCRQLRDRHDRIAAPLPTRWQVVEMSATPGEHEREAFTLGVTDLDGQESSLLARVVTASKPTTTVNVGQRRDTVADAVATWCVEHVGDSDRIRTGIVVNRVATAVSVARHLRDAGANAVLLTGRMRPHDRDDLVSSPDFSALSAGADEQSEPVVAVATQTIEVGVDLDFDELITEVAPVSSIRQRLGRLDRRGISSTSGSPATATILVPEPVRRAKDPDPVYGPALVHTIEWLDGFDGALDGGSLGPLSKPPIETQLPIEPAPIVLDSHLDALCQTSPQPQARPIPAQFLHGHFEDDTDIHIVWRADLEPGDVHTLDVVPPSASERMSVPLAAARRWLAGRNEELVPVADTGRAVPDDTDTTPAEVHGYRHDGERWTPLDIEQITPGDLIVVPGVAGGVAMGSWDPTSTEPVRDLGDRPDPAAPKSAASLRCNPAVTPPGVKPLVWDLDHDETSDGETSRQQITEWLRAINADATDDPTWAWWFELAARFAGVVDAPDAVDIERSGRWPVLQRVAPRVAAELDGTDDTMSFPGQALTLEQHLTDVEELAHEFAERVGLTSALASDLALAGRLHDLGKLDPRFQLMLHSGDRIAHATAPAPLAKSARRRPTDRAASLSPDERYPRGQRHELLSDAMIETNPTLTDGAHDLDLVRHLVAAHHGWCRPLPPPQHDPHPMDVAPPDGTPTSTNLEPTVAGIVVAERFWRLVRRYGWHGLAWLEAIFRLADHRASALRDSEVQS